MTQMGPKNITIKLDVNIPKYTKNIYCSFLRLHLIHQSSDSDSEEQISVSDSYSSFQFDHLQLELLMEVTDGHGTKLCYRYFVI